MRASTSASSPSCGFAFVVERERERAGHAVRLRTKYRSGRDRALGEAHSMLAAVRAHPLDNAGSRDTTGDTRKIFDRDPLPQQRTAARRRDDHGRQPRARGVQRSREPCGPAADNDELFDWSRAARCRWQIAMTVHRVGAARKRGGRLGCLDAPQ